MKACDFLFLFTILLFNNNNILALLRSKHNKVVTCYVASWAVYRPNNGQFQVPNIPAELCTHLVYAFAGLNSTSWTIRSLDPYLDIENGNYKNMTQLHERHPNLKVLLAIGGWNEGSKNYSDLVSSPKQRSTFINSVIYFLGKYNFNGFDLDWEYPGSGGISEDRENFVALVKELKEAFKKSKYLLTAAISANQGTIDTAYDIPEISKYLDFIHVMGYDYHGVWDKKVLPNAPLKSENGHSVMDTLNYLLRKGVPANKTVLGLPMYGRTFILTSKLNSSQESPINRPATSEGFKGPYTGEKGFMGYNEICEELVSRTNNWITGWDDNSDTPYAVDNDHVIVYDNPRSLKAKVEHAMSLNLAGIMTWSIDTDDFHGKCASLKDSLDRTETTYPLLRSINVVLSQSDNNNDGNNDVDNNNGNNDDDKGNNSSSIARSSYSFILITLASFIYYI